MQNLAGKYAIVTGGGQGIGEAVVQKFLDEEIAGVAILEWDKARGENTARRLDPSGTRVISIPCDVSNQEQVKAAVSTVMEVFGTIDILVNNAAITRDKIFWKMTDEMWDAVINVNLNGVYYLCKYVVPIMKEKKYGKIVNISSNSALGNPGQTNYAAAKAAVQGFTKTLAMEVAAHGITVNAIAPGGIATEMLSFIPADQIESRKAAYPIKRFGTPAELASVICFLSTDECPFLTSECIYVCGGKVTG